MDKEATIIINESNLNTGILLKENSLIHAGYYWHKIFVKNATKYSRDFVLCTIMKSVHPLDFIPVCYAIEDDEATFILRNCGQAIDKMCNLNLTIPHPDVQKKCPPFKLSICLKFAHSSVLKIEIQSNILQVLNQRYNLQSKTLNLENFFNDPNLIEFCPLSQPKLLFFVLYLVKDYKIVHLKLSGNELETLKPLDAIHRFQAGRSLSVLDINQNHISSHEELSVLKLFAITELMLRNNPMCENLSEMDYINLVRKRCPQITRIDNVPVSAVGSLSIKRNFLCDPSGQNFVDQFLEHYFTLYDSHNRGLLINMYHKNAMLSITSQTNGAQTEAMSLRLYNYKKLSRNLKTLSDLSRSHEYIFCGIGPIGNVLKMLPEAEHDPCTFTVDLLQFSEKNVTITITGVFKEPGQSLLESEYFYGFTRTFVLAHGVHGMEYQIVNEMLHVTNASACQQATAFTDVRIQRPSAIKVTDANTNHERNDMIGAFVALTNLVPEWAIKCLKEADFNLQDALGLFTTLLKADKLPAIAFDFSDMEEDPTPVAPPSVIVQSTESILPKLKPVEKVIQIKTTGTSASSIQSKYVAKPVQPKSYIPPKPHAQPPAQKKPKVAKQPSSKKQQATQEKPAKTKEKVLQNFTILAEPKTESLAPKNSEMPEGRTLVSLKPPEKKEMFDGTPLIATALPMPKRPGIVINLQKNRQTASPDAQIDNNEHKGMIVTDVGNLRNNIKDDIILRVLDMPLDTPINLVKQNLDSACTRVLKQYACALRYYKAIGREFYRFQLYSDARTFLTNAMATVPKKMGEQLYCIFTLFEIQYGEQNVAENMILIIGETFEISNAVVFLSQELPKTNAAFARKVFGMIAASALTKDKKAILIKAHIEFEKVFGNVETLKYANKAYQDNCASASPITNKVKEVRAEIKEETKPIVPENTCAVKQEVKDVSPVVEKPKESSSPLVQKVLNTTAEGNKELSLVEFRDNLLMISNIMPPRVAHEEVEHFLKQTDRETIEKVGEELLRKYSNNLYVIRIVCKTWQRTINTSKVAKAIAKLKKTFIPSPNTLNPLILYIKVREDIENKNFDDAKSKLFTHIKISTYVQIIQVFEDLLTDVRLNPDSDYTTFLDTILKEATLPSEIPLAKMQVLVSIYTTFCQFTKSSAADELYSRVFPKLKHYCPDDVLLNPKVRQNRALYEGQETLPKELNRYLSSYKPETFAEQIEEMRMHYYFQNSQKGRELRNSGCRSQDLGEVTQFKLFGACFEALFGTPNIGLNLLRKLKHEHETLNGKCAFMTVMLKMKNLGAVKKRLKQFFDNVVVVMNPYTQDMLYKYYKIWLKVGFDILDPSMQNHGVPDAPNT